MDSVTRMMRKKNQKIWEIVSRSIDTTVYARLKAIESQAKAFHALTYDTEATILREAEIMDLDDITVHADKDSAEFSHKNEHLFTVYYIDSEFYLRDEDIEDVEMNEKVDPKHLMEFYDFVNHAECEYCHDKGCYDAGQGPESKIEVCECENVIYQID